ncbi:MAG: TonB-dependent receptor plug domain-containing protein [Anaerolineae bacterium]|nr:TonB-dependent receptor plug domain-containing protein [Gloeobacterales cyanobacterium ES-bin-313]
MFFQRAFVLGLLSSALAFPVCAQTVITTPPAVSTTTDLYLPSITGAPLPPGQFLDEVVVTATRRPTRVRDTTVNTYVVTKQDIRSLGAINLREALQLVPGFSR